MIFIINLCWIDKPVATIPYSSWCKVAVQRCCAASSVEWSSGLVSLRWAGLLRMHTWMSGAGELQYQPSLPTWLQPLVNHHNSIYPDSGWSKVLCDCPRGFSDISSTLSWYRYLVSLSKKMNLKYPPLPDLTNAAQELMSTSSRFNARTSDALAPVDNRNIIIALSRIP